MKFRSGEPDWPDQQQRSDSEKVKKWISKAPPEMAIVENLTKMHFTDLTTDASYRDVCDLPGLTKPIHL